MTVRPDQSARRYRLSEIIDAIAVPAAVAFDRHARHIAVNAAFSKLLGVRSDDVIPITLPGAERMPYHFEVDGRPIAETRGAARTRRARRTRHGHVDRSRS